MSSCSFVVFSANPPVVFVIYRKKHVWPFSHALLFHKRRLKIGGKVRYLLSEILQKVSNIIMIFFVTAKGWQMKGSESRGWCGLILGGDRCYGNWLSCCSTSFHSTDRLPKSGHTIHQLPQVVHLKKRHDSRFL